jgi:hypothetical protein
MRLKILALALMALVHLPVSAQGRATVHLYRTGYRGPLHVRIDGQDIFKIENNHIATFTITPGNHEISVGFEGIGSGNAPNGVVALQAKSGGDYYLHVDYEFSARRAFMGGGANSMNMRMQQEQGAPPDLKDQKLGEKELTKAASIIPVASAQQAVLALPVSTLPDEEINAAILQGIHDPNPNNIGLYLSDMQTALFSGIADNGASATSGFSVVIFSPKRWIEFLAAVAHQQMRPFSLNDITPEMRADVIHILALPDTPDRLNSVGIAASSGVVHVVICDRTRTITVQPLNEAPSAVTVDSALRSKDYAMLASDFNRAEVEQIREADKKREFFVVVIGNSGIRKFFDVKQRYESWVN